MLKRSVPEAELKQLKVMGCVYSWKEKKDGKTETTLEANLTMVRVHDKLDEAKLWFKNATTDKTGKELEKEMAQVTAKAKEHEDVDTDPKRKTVGTLGSIMARSMNDGTTYEAISGIGDEAKVALRDGAIWVRVGNLTFTVNAYKGPPQPSLDLDMKDMRRIRCRSGCCGGPLPRRRRVARARESRPRKRSPAPAQGCVGRTER